MALAGVFGCVWCLAAMGTAATLPETPRIDSVGDVPAPAARVRPGGHLVRRLRRPGEIVYRIAGGAGRQGSLRRAGPVHARSLREGATRPRQPQGLLRRQPDRQSRPEGQALRRHLLAGLREAPVWLDGRRAGQAVPRHQHRLAELGAGDDRPRLEQRRGPDARSGQRRARRSGRDHQVQRLRQPALAGQQAGVHIQAAQHGGGGPLGLRRMPSQAEHARPERRPQPALDRRPPGGRASRTSTGAEATTGMASTPSFWRPTGTRARR